MSQPYDPYDTDLLSRVFHPTYKPEDEPRPQRLSWRLLAQRATGRIRPATYGRVEIKQFEVDNGWDQMKQLSELFHGGRSLSAWDVHEAGREDRSSWCGQ